MHTNYLKTSKYFEPRTQRFKDKEISCRMKSCLANLQVDVEVWRYFVILQTCIQLTVEKHVVYK